MIEILEDSQGRNFPYLRLSITDVCNFSCTYCLPNGYQKTGLEKENLSVDEIQRLVRGFAELGTSKIRITGGEPTVRKDYLEVAKAINAVKGIEKIAITTNGYKLDQQAEDIYNAGIRSINVSVDSLSPDKFQEITGYKYFDKVINGIDKCLELGFDKVKINAVLLNDVNDIEFDQFMLYTKMKKVDVRFIELMHTGDNVDLFDKHHVSSDALKFKLESEGWVKTKRGLDAGPALEYSHPTHKGKMGVIAPYSKDFCKGCNRLRVSARGELQLCLFGNGRQSLRHLLQRDDQIEELKTTIQDALNYKKTTHFLHNGDYGITQNLASIGG